MENDDRTIKEVVRTVRDQRDEEVSAVRCQDGSYGVARDGRLMDALRWDADKLDECLRFLDHFSKTM